MILMCYLGGEKMKLKIMKFFAVLLAALIGIGALKPCEAIEPLPLEIETQLADLYYDYQNKKAKATNLSESLQASMEFFTKFENLRSTHNHLLAHFLSLFCRGDIPVSVRNYSELTVTFTTYSINRLSGRIMFHIASYRPIYGIIHSFEL